jgi:invasion protein IalB
MISLSPIRKAAFGGIFVAAALALSFAAEAQEVLKGKVGAWEIRCQSSAGQAEKCGLTQTVRSEDKAGVNIAVIIVKAPGAKAAVLRVIAPIAVYLVNGVGVKIDQTDMGKLPFFRCTPAGCLTEAPLDEKILDQMRNGKILSLVIYLEPEEGLRHLVRLDGFKEALEKLP